MLETSSLIVQDHYEGRGIEAEERRVREKRSR